MLRKKLVLVLCCYIFLSAFHCSFAETVKPTAQKGELDLSKWDFRQDGILPLNGEWEFYWEELFSPTDVMSLDHSPKQQFIMLPRAWNKLVIDGKELSGDGYATYRLTVRYPGKETLGLKIPRIFTSYQLWLNNELLAAAGEVGTDQEQMTPQYLPQVKYFQTNNDILEIVLQVSNSSHRSGGILESIKIGTADQISNERANNLALQLFLFGSLSIIGIYHITLYAFRTKDKSALYFGVYSLLISVRTLLVGEIFLIHLFPGFHWELAHKAQTLAYYLGVLLVFLFLKSLFPNEFSRTIDRTIRMVTSAFSLLVLLTPAKIFTIVNPAYQVFSIIAFLYFIFVVFLACRRKREGSLMIAAGILLLFLFSLNDILFLSTLLADSNNHFLRAFVARGDLSSIGLLLFVLIQSLVVAKKFSKSYSEVELLSMELKEVNTSLEERVRERTLELEVSREDLKNSYEAVSRSEKSLQDFMQNISHDLKTPLSSIKGYAGAILDGVVKDPALERKYIRRIEEKSDHLTYMVQEILDLSKLQTGQLSLQLVKMPLNLFVRTFTEKISLDMKGKHVDFRVRTIPNPEKNSIFPVAWYVAVDAERMERVFSNLLNNALKFTEPGGSIDLSFEMSSDTGKLKVGVSDTGIGIPKDELHNIFQRFYMVSKSREPSRKGSGLGLTIVKEIVESHDGEMWVESELNRGSSFFFTLPVYQNENEKKILQQDKYREELLWPEKRY